jgi:subtilisin family serine protease
MAPGKNIISTAAGGGHIKLNGTSFATPFVTGTLALLWSIFPKVTAAELIYSVTRNTTRKTRSILPPLLDAHKALELLQRKSN